MIAECIRQSRPPANNEHPRRALCCRLSGGLEGMHLSNTMLDVLGTAPVEAVIIYTWSRVLHMRNRAAFYLLMSSCMLVVVLTRGDAGTGMRSPTSCSREACCPSSWQTSVLREKCSSLRS